MFKLRMLPWEYGVRNLFRRPSRSVLTLGGLTTVILLIFVVVAFIRSRRIFQLVVAESMVLSSAGGIIGIGLGLGLLAFTGFSVAAEGVSIAFRPSTNLAVVGAIVSVAVGLLAGVVPGWQAARTNDVDALRHTG